MSRPCAYIYTKPVLSTSASHRFTLLFISLSEMPFPSVDITTVVNPDGSLSISFDTTNIGIFDLTNWWLLVAVYGNAVTAPPDYITDNSAILSTQGHTSLLTNFPAYSSTSPPAAGPEIVTQFSLPFTKTFPSIVPWMSSVPLDNSSTYWFMLFNARDPLVYPYSVSSDGVTAKAVEATTSTNDTMYLNGAVIPPPACFVPGTQITTLNSTGDDALVTVEALRSGDRVRTADGRTALVRSVRSWSMDVAPSSWLPIELRDAAGAVVVVLSPGHAVWDPVARHFFLAGSYVTAAAAAAADAGTRAWRGRRMEELFRRRIEYWHVQLPDFATDALVLSKGVICEALDGGSAVDPGHKSGRGWKGGVHPLQRQVPLFAHAEPALADVSTVRDAKAESKSANVTETTSENKTEAEKVTEPSGHTGIACS